MLKSNGNYAEPPLKTESILRRNVKSAAANPNQSTAYRMIPATGALSMLKSNGNSAEPPLNNYPP